MRNCIAVLGLQRAIKTHHDKIFRQGFALRDGGSGQGLALVRDIIETEMRDEARCEQSEMGGARFVLAVPVVSSEAP